MDEGEREGEQRAAESNRAAGAESPADGRDGGGA